MGNTPLTLHSFENGLQIVMFSCFWEKEEGDKGGRP